jgi:hypothetical protein
MNTIVLQKTYHLYQSLNKIVSRFPKKDRYGLGLKLENNCLTLLEQIIMAEQTMPVLKDRALIESSVRIEILKILLRLTMEKQLIKETVYFSLASLIIEIGKMIGGWRKSLRQ